MRHSLDMSVELIVSVRRTDDDDDVDGNLVRVWADANAFHHERISFSLPARDSSLSRPLDDFNSN